MGTVISNLKAHFGVDTTDFKAGLKDGEKAMSDFKGAAGGQIDEFARLFGVNICLVLLLHISLRRNGVLNNSPQE